MLKRTTPMKRGQGLRNRTPLQRVKASRGEGLGHKVVMAIGGARPVSQERIHVAAFQEAPPKRRGLGVLGHGPSGPGLPCQF